MEQRFNLVFTKGDKNGSPFKSGQSVPFGFFDPALLAVPDSQVYITVDEVPGDSPFATMIPTVYAFRVVGVQQHFKGNHAGAVKVAGDFPTLFLQPILNGQPI